MQNYESLMRESSNHQVIHTRSIRERLSMPDIIRNNPPSINGISRENSAKD